MLEQEYSKIRQARLRSIMADRNLDAIITGLRHHAYYFSSHLPFWQHEGVFLIFRDGSTILVAANCEPNAAATDEVIPFEAHYAYTLRQEQPQVVAEIIVNVLKQQKATRVGIDSSAVTMQVALQSDAVCSSIDEDLWQLRRAKDPDELALMKTAIACSEAMHAKAREIIRPGISEIEVYGVLHAVAVECAGEPMSAWLGNDYRCAAMGGTPRANCTAKAGEIYILDLGPTYRGYFADNARSYAVGGNPSDAQEEARQVILEVMQKVESMAKPGVSCQEIHEAAADILRTRTDHEMAHHLGHGVGLQPHEYPHLNPSWDDTLLEGEVFTVEPGIYSKELAEGLRIENQYLVTSNGVDNLVNIPTDLA